MHAGFGGGSRETCITIGGFVVKHPDDRQGARLLPNSVLTILLAGGKGTRLDPLTRDRAKPAVPFAGMYRIADVALSHCVNSRLFNMLA